MLLARGMPPSNIIMFNYNGDKYNERSTYYGTPDVDMYEFVPGETQYDGEDVDPDILIDVLTGQHHITRLADPVIESDERDSILLYYAGITNISFKK